MRLSVPALGVSPLVAPKVASAFVTDVVVVGLTSAGVAIPFKVRVPFLLPVSSAFYAFGVAVHEASRVTVVVLYTDATPYPSAVPSALSTTCRLTVKAFPFRVSLNEWCRLSSVAPFYTL